MYDICWCCRAIDSSTVSVLGTADGAVISEGSVSVVTAEGGGVTVGVVVMAANDVTAVVMAEVTAVVGAACVFLM